MLQVSKLFIYPVKSLGGIAVDQTTVTDRGFEYDRRWMLIDEQHGFLTQREHAAMALLQVRLSENGLQVFHKQDERNCIDIPFEVTTPGRIQTHIWGVPCNPLHVDKQADEWFSDILHTKCKLVFMDDATKVLINEQYNINGHLTSFSDGFPILMISEASLADLNNRLTEKVPMNRFRPNLVISGAAAYEEDELSEFIINSISFRGVKPSARCVITTIDQQNGEKRKEPLKTLSLYRSLNNKIYFGENLIALQTGHIRTGDVLEIIKRKKGLFSLQGS